MVVENAGGRDPVSGVLAGATGFLDGVGAAKNCRAFGDSAGLGDGDGGERCIRCQQL